MSLWTDIYFFIYGWRLRIRGLLRSIVSRPNTKMLQKSHLVMTKMRLILKLESRLNYAPKGFEYDLADF